VYSLVHVYMENGKRKATLHISVLHSSIVELYRSRAWRSLGASAERTISIAALWLFAAIV